VAEVLDTLDRIRRGEFVLSSPTGQSASAWTNDETERMRAAFKAASEAEASLTWR
jgi:hypothetical protein